MIEIVATMVKNTIENILLTLLYSVFNFVDWVTELVLDITKNK